MSFESKDPFLKFLLKTEVLEIILLDGVIDSNSKVIPYSLRSGFLLKLPQVQGRSYLLLTISRYLVME